MTERPILFSTPMIQSLQRSVDPKWQTRRLNGLDDVNEVPDIWELVDVGPLGYMTKKSARGKYGATFQTREIVKGVLHICPQVCPYGAVGDRLWGRESHYFDNLREAMGIDDWFMDCTYIAGGPKRYIYECDAPIETSFKALATGKRRPGIHMHRWASRILLEITEIRVERLRDISVADAIAEGIAPLFDLTDHELPPDILEKYKNGPMPWRNYLWHGLVGRGITQKQADAWTYQYSSYDGPIGSYASLWESINGPGSWALNPWVWAVSFRRVER